LHAADYHSSTRSDYQIISSKVMVLVTTIPEPISEQRAATNKPFERAG
jgi:hypothetical protein